MPVHMRCLTGECCGGRCCSVRCAQSSISARRAWASLRVKGRHSMSSTDGPERPQNTYETDVATSAKSSQEIVEIYDSWAEDYERRILGNGYSTPSVVTWF